MDKKQMRNNIRIKIGHITIFFMIAHTQRLNGFTNKVNACDYFYMWDLEGCTLKEAEKEMKRIQKKYNLGEIYITSDRKKSFQVWCFTLTTKRNYIKCLAETKYYDWYFLKYTVRREEATLRLTDKQNRKPLKIVSIIKGRKEKIPSNMKLILYDTGREKKAHTLNVEVL